jgi:NAD+ synthase (glutamine-hydrolysing)
VVSVSGGIDSAVTYGLMLEASKKPGSPIKKTLGIAQPIHSTSAVWKRAYELRPLGGTIITVDQTNIFDQLAGLVGTASGLKDSQFATGQLRSYMRTPVNYYVAQLLSANGNLSIVLGTGNYDEDGYLRYFCKAGDGTVDVQLIADLHKSEVFAVARELGVPKSILVAPPTADLWEGQTDEDEMGFSYDFVELFTTWLQYSDAEKKAFLARLGPEAKQYFTVTGEKAKQIHERNAHKASWPINL